MHYLVDEYTWKSEDKADGAGAIVMLYNKSIYNQDKKSYTFNISMQIS